MNKPVVHLFHLGVDEENNDTFFRVGTYNFTTSYETEVGTLAMYAGVIKNNPLEYMVLEVYADERAYQIHKRSPQFQAYVEQLGSKLTKREVYEVEAVFLEEKLTEGVWLGEKHHYLKFACIQVKDGHQEDFEKSVLGNMQISLRDETGFLAMYALRDRKNHAIYYFYELYASADAYEYHRASKHFQRYLAETQDIMVEKILLDLENSIAISRGQVTFSN